MVRAIWRTTLAVTIGVAVVMASRVAAARDGDCGSGNLLSNAQLAGWLDTLHYVSVLTDGEVAPEGTRASPSQTVAFASDAASITYDLGAACPIRTVFLQADGGGTYSLQGSLDGQAWRAFSIEPARPEVASPGMRSRLVQIDGLSARFVRIGEPSGPGPHAVAEAQIYSRPVDDPSALHLHTTAARLTPNVQAPASMGLWLALTGAPWLTDRLANTIKLALCLSALCVLAIGAFMRRARAIAAFRPRSGDRAAGLRPPGPFGLLSGVAVPMAVVALATIAFVMVAATCTHGLGSPWSIAAIALCGASSPLLFVVLEAARRGALRDRRLRRALDAFAVALAVVALAGYWNWGSYRFPDFVHTHEFFHYFVGSKYFKELGYTRLYDGAVLASAEDGLARRIELGTVRDLATNEISGGDAALRRARSSRALFSPERWAAFKVDVAYFRDASGIDGWRRILNDHGYNPSPLWTMVGGAFACVHRASRRFIGYADSMTYGWLALLDPVLLLATVTCVTWGFGRRAGCVAAFFIGCNPLAGYAWTGGSFIRQDWLLATVLGVVLWKKRRPVLAGWALGYAALVRVFPAVFFIPIAFQAVRTWRRERRVDPIAARAIAAAALATAVLVPSSGWASGRGLAAWREFADNTAKLAATPSANLVGLPALLSFRPSTRAELLIDPAKDDAFAAVRDARRRNLAAASPLLLALVAGFVALFVVAWPRIGAWRGSAALGATFVPIFFQLPCYYAACLLPLAAAGERQRLVHLVFVAMTAGLCIASALTDQEDVFAAWASAIVVIAVAGIVALFGHSTHAREGRT